MHSSITSSCKEYLNKVYGNAGYAAGKSLFSRGLHSDSVFLGPTSSL